MKQRLILSIVFLILLAVDQDALGTQGKRVRHENDQDVWVKPLQDGAIAVVMLNRGATQQTITLNWDDLGISP